MVLFVSPLASSPSSGTVPTAVPEEPDSVPVFQPVDTDSLPAELTVSAVIDEEGYGLLMKQGERYQESHPELEIHWNRIEPEDADTDQEWLAIADQADVVLVPNEWIRLLAVSGKLSPVDTAFVGEAQSEQFDALISQVKWNLYLWGVPKDFDPYVLVWNRNVLEAVRSETDGMELPLKPEQWQSLPQKLRDAGLVSNWLAIDRKDPYALLAWLGAVTGEREDVLFEADAKTWGERPLEAALTLLAQEQAGIASAGPSEDPGFWPAFAAGRYAAAIVRNSEAEQAFRELPDSSSAALKIDRESWNSAFVWPGGTSFGLSSGSNNKEAAIGLIAEMTSEDNQWQNYLATDRLPVYRSLYEGSKDMLPVSVAVAQRFPNQATVSVEPGIPSRASLLKSLWSKWLAGGITLPDWRARWEASAGLLAELESDD